MILKIIPFLVTMFVAISMFKGAGGIDLLTRLLSPVLTPIRFPPNMLPLALMRPLSGSATLAILTDIIHPRGPDTRCGHQADNIVFRVGASEANAARNSGGLAWGPGWRLRFGNHLPGGVLIRLAIALLLVIGLVLFTSIIITITIRRGRPPEFFPRQ